MNINMKNRNLIYLFVLIGLILIFTSSCSKSDSNDDNNLLSGETVTDIDGNVYYTKVIGDQTWMTENLKVLHYNDGTAPIPVVTDGLDWSTRTDAACCIYNNDHSNYSTYGVLYNWYAASDSKLCPKGWHVATNDEWIIMYSWLNDIDAGGGKLKETGITHWSSPNTGANNSTGFTALPGGQRNNNGLFNYLFFRGYTWSSTGTKNYPDTEDAWYGWVSYDQAKLDFHTIDKRYGFSERCIKDKPIK
jgi:uncharacterized protein (TIGR02145 family)